MRRCVGRRPFRWSGGGERRGAAHSLRPAHLHAGGAPEPQSASAPSQTPAIARLPACPRMPHPPTHPPTCPRTHTPTTACGRPPVLTPALPSPDQVCLRFPSPRFPFSSRRFPVSSAFAAPTPSIDRHTPPSQQPTSVRPGGVSGGNSRFGFLAGRARVPAARDRSSLGSAPNPNRPPARPARPRVKGNGGAGRGEPTSNPD